LLEGLYTAAAGMAAQQQRMDHLANDVANVNTAGYKHVRTGFRDLMYSQTGRGAANTVTAGAGAAAQIVGRSFAQGSLRQTGQPLDVAIQGEGFLRVRLADGTTGLTRDGSLHIDGDGRLVTSTGAFVQPAITFPADTDTSTIKIESDGAVRAGERAVGRLELVSVRSPQRLLAAGDNVFVPTPESGAPRPAPAATTITQGALEGSNVDVSEAMVAMIESQRAFQLTSKAISTADQMWEIANGVKR
jgi:flagellar basal-body rod protein FlgG